MTTGLVVECTRSVLGLATVVAGRTMTLSSRSTPKILNVLDIFLLPLWAGLLFAHE